MARSTTGPTTELKVSEGSKADPDPDPGPDSPYGDIDPKRLRFFEAAEPLFERFGFRKTTVEDICATG
jgi:AcrR family transcriptional regulator